MAVTRAWRVVADNSWPLDGIYKFSNPRAIPSALGIKTDECKFHPTGKKLEGDWVFYVTWKPSGEVIAMYTLGKDD